MFYSHQLLARKAPLGQIWMAATMHAKMNRKKLNKINIIKICEEILNPSVPMALRLSGILMGGVVIVYERKVKLLYDDVTRFLVQVNEAWKVKPAPDPTVLPKGKSQAKKEAVTLPENQETDLGDIEHSVNFPNSDATMGFQRTAYFSMRLDDIEDPEINNDPMEANAHQADAENIKLYERFDYYQTQIEHNRFDRFDIEEDEETNLNVTSGDHMDIPVTARPSPPIQEEVPRDGVQDPPEPEVLISQQLDECNKAVRQEQVREEPVKKRTRRHANAAMDYDQTIIPGHIYHSWLQNTSAMLSRRGRKRKASMHIIRRMKIANLMELPPLVLGENLITHNDRKIYYPAPLLDLWMKSTQPPHDSPSAARTSVPPEPSSSSPPEGGYYQDSTGYSPAGIYSQRSPPVVPHPVSIHSGVGSGSLNTPIELQRTHVVKNVILMEGVTTGLVDNGRKSTEGNVVTPGNTDDEVKSIPSSGSGHGLTHHSEVHSGRASKKRPHSSSRHSGSSLDTVVEEMPIPEPQYELSRLSENDPTTDQDILVETGPTQTQRAIISQKMDKITDKFKMQIKEHFDTPGAPAVESLNKLADGMTRKVAAMLFYQTCVLATRDCLKVEQNAPYGDIIISKGRKL